MDEVRKVGDVSKDAVARSSDASEVEGRTNADGIVERRTAREGGRARPKAP